MQLAIEERDLQKMATLSQNDEKLSELQTKLETITKVSLIIPSGKHVLVIYTPLYPTFI